MKRIVLSVVLFLLALASLRAQVHHLRFGLEQGLPSNTTYGICQDEQGRIWVATENGLVYLENGLLHPVKDLNLPKQVLRVYARRDSGVVIVGNNPVGAYQVFRDGPSKALELPAQFKAFDGLVVAFSKNEDALYFGDKGHKLLKTTLDRLDTILDLHSKGTLKEVLVQSNGTLSLCVGQSIARFHDDQFEVIVDQRRNSDSVYTYAKVGGTDSLYHLVQIPWAPDMEMGERPIHSIQTTHGLLFSGLEYGLYSYENGEINVFSDLLNAGRAQFTYLFKDRAGNVWCSTSGLGLFLIPNHTDIRSFNQTNGLEDGYISKLCCVGPNETVIATRSNVYQLTRGTRDVEVLKGRQDYKRILAPSIRDVVVAKGRKIFGSYLLINSRPVFTETNYGLGVGSSSFYLDSNRDLLWFAGWGSIGAIPLSNLEEENLPVPSVLTKERGLGRVACIIPLDSNLIITSATGVYRYDVETESVEQMICPLEPNGFFVGVARARDKLYAVSVNHVYELNQRRQWVRSQITQNQVYSAFTCVSSDHEGRLWIGTENGLLRCDGNHITEITTGNGLLSNYITQIELSEYDSSLWIGTNKGVTVLAKSINFGDKTPYPIQLKSIEVLVGDNPRTCLENEFKSSESSLAFTIELEDYFGFNSVDYRYRLSGTNAQWNHTTLPEIKLLALSSGEHSLEVQARIPGKRWTESLYINFVVRLPFWKRWTFYIVISVLLIGLITLVYLVRLRQEMKLNDERRKASEKMNQLELQALNANMHPHFIFNSLNSIQNYLVPTRNIKAIDHVGNLSKLIRLNMKAIGKKAVTLKGELERLELYIELERERLSQELIYHVKKSILTDTSDIKLPSMIIQPLVENSIWHGIMPSGRPGKIEVDISLEESMLTIQVLDNGVGLSNIESSKRKGHKSVGLSLIRERLKIYHPENSLEVLERVDAQGKTIGAKAVIHVHALV
ncbi:MAG: histidine kinase [Bacteroidia bacterium]|nr:histidine kinase [Bacteroidia bacterium]